MNTSILRQSRSSLCHKLSAYDYQRDGTGHHKFTDFQCGTVCHLGQREKNCVGASDVLQGDNQNVFIPTAMERTYINFNGDVETARHLIPLEHDVQINLEYQVSMGVATSSMNMVKTIEDFSAHSSSSSYTLLLDSSDRVFKSIAPSLSGIPMKLIDILHLTGKSDWLDSPQLPLGKNQLDKPGVFLGPAGRVSGLSINMEMMCYSHSQTPSKFRVQGWDGALCLLRATPQASHWVRRTASQYVEGVAVDTTYHGVAIRVSIGSLQRFDMLGCIAFITQAYVMSKVPTMLCGFFVLCCLGEVSKIYHGMVYKKWNVTQQMIHAVMHMICNSILFDNLVGANDGISLKTLKQKLAYGLQGNDELDETELHALALFCFDTAQDIENHRFSEPLKHLRSAFLEPISQHLPPSFRGRKSSSGSSIRSADFNETCLNMKEFMTTMLITESLSLKSLVRMFDVDRKRGFVEWFFVSGFVREELQFVKKIRESCAASSARTPHLHADELRVKEPTGLENRTDVSDSPAGTVEVEKTTGLEHNILHTGGVEQQRPDKRVQGIDHVHEDLNNRLLVMEARVAAFMQQGQLLMHQNQQEVAQRLESNEQQLAYCFKYVQYLEHHASKHRL